MRGIDAVIYAFSAALIGLFMIAAWQGTPRAGASCLPLPYAASCER